MHSQKRLLSWSQSNIENYTKEMYDEAQKLSINQLLEKNKNVQYWSEVFLILNASLNNHSKNNEYIKLLTEQITDKIETKLKGTSRLIIWERISNGDIIFEGKGIIFENDLFTVSGRANELLQGLTGKNFGYVYLNSTDEDLKLLKRKWEDFLNGKSIEEYNLVDTTNAKIPEITSLFAVEALIYSLQENMYKDSLTRNCLKNVYKLDEMPNDKSSSAIYCNPDTYTFGYLAMLFGDEKTDEAKNAKWWLEYWKSNKTKLKWNSVKGIFEINN